MKNKAFTLLELMVSIILVMIVSSALTTLFTVERTQTMLTQRQVALSEEALVAMNHMEWILRFAIPGTVNIAPNQITATIAGGHIAIIPANTAVRYNRTEANTLTLTFTATNQTVNIANNITFLNVTRNNDEISITVTAAEHGSTISLQTTVRALGA